MKVTEILEDDRKNLKMYRVYSDDGIEEMLIIQQEGEILLYEPKSISGDKFQE